MKKIFFLCFVSFLMCYSVLRVSAADLCNGVTKEFLSAKLPFSVDEVLDKQSLADYKLCQAIIRSQSEQGAVYVTANKQGVLLGNLFVNNQVYSEIAMNNLHERSFKKHAKSLAELVAFSYKPTGAKKTIYMFTDPDCPACNETKAKVQEWAFEKKVEVRVIFLPLPMHPAAKDKAVRGICGNMTFDNYLQGQYVGQPCEEGEKKIEDVFKISTELGIEGTPSFIGPTGKKVLGYSRENLDKIL